MNDSMRYAVDIHDAVARLFDKDDENFKYSLSDVNGTAFFTGFIMAFNLLFGELMDDEDGDLVDTVNIANRLVIQYLMSNNDEE